MQKEKKTEYSRLKKITETGNTEGLMNVYDIVNKEGLVSLTEADLSRITGTIESTLRNSFKGVVAQDILIIEGEKPEIKVKGKWSVLEQCEEWDLDSFNYFLFNMSKLSTKNRDGNYKFGKMETVREDGKELSKLTFIGPPVDIRSKLNKGTYGSKLLDTQFFKDLMKEEGMSYDYSLNMVSNILRCHVFSAYGGGMNKEKVGMSIRVVPQQIPRLRDLNLPKKLEDITKHAGGLFLVSGHTGDGKSTTVASIINKFNLDPYGRRVITIIEDPVEYIHKSVNAKIIQRRLGENVPSYARATSDALRESTDIVVLGELRTKDEIINALRLAEVGKMVIATIHGNSVAHTVDRFIGEFTTEEQHYRGRLLENLLGILHQNLVVYEGEQFPISSLLLLENEESKSVFRTKGFTRETITEVIESGENLWAVSREEWFKELEADAQELQQQLDQGNITGNGKEEVAMKKLKLLKGDARKVLSISK